MDRYAVIARHQEDVSWSDDLTCPSWIYDKSEQSLPGSISLPNVGRESQTYLFHIVHHYHTLPDHVAFLQGWPWDHVPDRKTAIDKIHGSKELFDTLGAQFYLALDDLDERYPFVSCAEKWHQRLFGEDLPERAIFVPGACFLVASSRIRRWPLSFWEHLLSVASDTAETWAFGYAMERLWPTLFFGPQKKFDHL